jgi:hypothetical protein
MTNDSSGSSTRSDLGAAASSADASAPPAGRSTASAGGSARRKPFVAPRLRRETDLIQGTAEQGGMMPS